MPKPLIHLDDSQLAFFQSILDFANKHFGALIVPFTPTINETSGPGLALAASLGNIKSFLKPVFLFSPAQIEERAQFLIEDAHLQELNKKMAMAQQPLMTKEQAYRGFYDSLNERYIKAFSACSYILTALDEYKKANSILNTDAYHLVAGYFSLFACILAYNSYIICQDHEHPDEVMELIATMRKWLHKFELAHLPHCQDESIHALHDTFFVNFQDLRQQQLSRDDRLTLSLTALTEQVQRKNDRAQQFGAPYNGKIIFNTTAKNTETLCANALGELVEQILALQHEASGRKQFLFYPGASFGAVEVIDAKWDPVTEQFNIINIHGANSALQYNILKQLCERLTQVGVGFNIIACQSKLQQLCEDPSSLYAYALSGLVSKLSFEQLKGSPFSCEQPAFVEYNGLEAVTQAPLEKVSWVNLSALGTKALLMKTPKTAYEFQALVKVIKELDPSVNMTSLMQKQGIALNPAKGSTISYVQSLHNRMQYRQAKVLFSLEALIAQFKTTDLGQALRRATLHADTDTFEFLLKEMSTMTLDDGSSLIDCADSTENKHFTPLHLALRADKDTRAVKLLRLGNAKTDIKDDTEKKQTAREIFECAPQESALKNNPILGAIMRK